MWETATETGNNYVIVINSKVLPAQAYLILDDFGSAG